ncbi:hypothetical protein RHGRI_029086 [Rhododendron griersonianum]|uniref:Uncharacterized protein n=1 Tax=Rhododendron griersonianum TaxID=479676 RepID=A0AAV6II41_9ERIC|nr:hypothetical protein RHGRI_029086 [Rhododendron griersonianum]
MSGIYFAGVFLAVSSNTRYQIINGLERLEESSPLAKKLRNDSDTTSESFTRIDLKYYLTGLDTANPHLSDMPEALQSHGMELAYQAIDLHEVSDCQSIAHFIKQKCEKIMDQHGIV